MASLNTLRTKGGIIVSVVIGLALVAFLLSDLTSARSGIFGKSNNRVGVIDGNSIDYQEYAQEAEYMTRIAQLMSGTESLNTEQTEQARNMAWESLVQKYAIMPGYENLGIRVSGAEQGDMVSGTYISPVITSMFTNPSTGMFDPALLQEFHMNKDRDASGNTTMWWEYMKDRMCTERLTSKFMALITAGMYTIDLETEEGVKAANNLYSARYISQSYSSIPDSLITVTSSQVRKYYADHKDMFHQGESRTVDYVMFDLVPSEDDNKQALETVEKMAVEFAASEDPMQYAVANSQQSPDKRYLAPSVIDPAILSAISSDRTALYGPVRNGEEYTMTRLADTRSLPDSIGARHILLMSTQTALADSIVTALKGKADFAALAQQYSIDKQTPDGDLGVFSPENMIPEISEACFKANKGDIFTVNTNYGIHILQLTYKSAPVQKMQLATVTYTVEPSSATEQVIYGQASSFLAAAAGKGMFDKAADDAGLSKRIATISNVDRNINGIQNSHELVRWAFNAKKGDVSKEIMEINGNYVVATLTDVRHEGIAPVEQVAQSIQGLLIREGKAKQLSEKMKGTSLDQIASTFAAEVFSVAGLQRSSFYVEGGAGVEPKLIGAICDSQAGTLSKPVEGMTGVFVFEVTNVENVENATKESEYVRIDAMSKSYIGPRVNQAIYELCKVSDLRVKFF